MAAGLARVKPSQHQAARCRAACREHRRTVSSVGINGDKRFAAQRVNQSAAARELAVQVSRKSVAGDEDMRFAAEAPAERGR